MSTQRLPAQIAPFKLARQGQKLQGVLGMNSMERLAEAVAEAGGDIQVDLQFGMDEQGTYFARGHLSANVQMICQRCMKPLTLPIDADVTLAFISSDEGARGLPQGYEPYIVMEEPVTLAEIVEEELILALPIVALHDESECEPTLEKLQAEADKTGQAGARQNPFAVLSDLKRQK